MLIPSLTVDEELRIQTLHSLAILDSEREKLFQDIVNLSSFVTSCPISLISLIDTDRQWFKARIGLEVEETHRDISFCGHAIHKDEIFVVEDALKDSRFTGNPLVIGEPHIRFYAGAPLITSNGFRIGTLCVIDRRPKSLDSKIAVLLEGLARQATFLIERRKNELALASIRKNSQILFDGSPVIVTSTKGPNHRFDYVNAAHKKLLGGADATGKTILEVQPEASETGFLSLLDEVYKTGETRSVRNCTFEIRGQPRDLNCFLSPSYGLDGRVEGVMSIIDDITDRRNLERRVEVLNAQKEARFLKMTELLERVPIAIVWLEGPKHRVIFANYLYRKYFFNNRPLDGKLLPELFPRSERQSLADILDRVYTTGEAYVGKEARVIRSLPTGEKQISYFNFIYETASTAEGTTTGVFAAISDVTEQVLSRAEISLKVDALTEEQEIREQFVAMLSHDLRTPLTAARITAERIGRKAADPKRVQELSARIIESIDRGEGMVRDLLDANRIKAGEGIPISVTECCTEQIIDGAKKFIRMTTRRDVKLSIQNRSLRVYWDPSAVQRIIENLISNAIKYGTPGAVISVEVHEKSDEVVLSVHNHGPAIPKTDQKILFETFRRTESALKGEQKGWGIGLTLVRGISDAHRGTVNVESDDVQGTTFYVRLPFDCR